MKRLLMVLMISFLLIGIASAQGEKDGTGLYHDDVIAAGGQGGDVDMEVGLYSGSGAKMMKSGDEFRNEYGQTVRLSGEDDKLKLHVGNYSIDCEKCNLTQEMGQNRTMIKATLSNGRNAEIKVMPDRASETALNRLRLKVCAENCTIELKEVGSGNETRLAYALNATKNAKVFGLFKAKANVEAQIDAETGEVIASKKPWWLALSSTED